jgi:hypothetical protein
MFSRSLVFLFFAVSLLCRVELYSQSLCNEIPPPEDAPCNEPWSTILQRHTVTTVIPNTVPPCTLTYTLFYYRRCDEFDIVDWGGGWSQCAQDYINSFGNATPPKSPYDVTRELKQLAINEFIRQMTFLKFGPADNTHRCADGNYRTTFSAFESLCQSLVWKFKKQGFEVGTGNEWVTLTTTQLPLNSTWQTIVNTVNANLGDINTLTVGFGGNCGSGCCRKRFLTCWDHITGAWNVYDAGGEIHPPGMSCPTTPNTDCFNSCTTQ